METEIKMTAEQFSLLTKKDKWISAIANPTKCYDKCSKFKHYKTCSYPTEYIITEEQIQKANELYVHRKTETLASIFKGELVFRAMGGDFQSEFENGVGNYRIRCYFKSINGHKYFIELCCSSGRENEFLVNFSVDEDLREKRDEEIKLAYEYRRKVNGHWFIDAKQDYYNCYGVEKKYQNMPFTFDNIIKFVNKTYGCSYKKARLIHSFVDYTEWCCECQE